MIKAIIFDFDGVLVESAQIKTEAFKIIFSKWKDKVDEIVTYHRLNMGVSRYVKFRYIYENILKEPFSETTGKKLGEKFSELVVEKIRLVPFVDGVLEFMEENHKEYMLFIASGTPQEELEDIVKFKGIEKYFIGVFGTPASKTEIIKNIIISYSLNPREIIFIGDANSDKIAAEAAGVHFVLRRNSESDIGECFYEISDIKGLKKIIERI